MRKLLFWRKKVVDYCDRECCHNCQFGRAYDCRRHAPTVSADGLSTFWPTIYNDGLGEWCGDWEKIDKQRKKR